VKKILVLTGTTGYPMLEQSILDIAAQTNQFQFVLQTKNNLTASPGVKHQSFINMKQLDCSEFDGIVGHCGAGTTFWALDNNLRFLAVVDLERSDKHQQDLGLWLSKNNYGLVVENRPLTSADLEELLTRQFSNYHKDPFQFHKFDELL
jgi:UDP-N-acetylglucosamine transferase subunit ALG13